MAVNARQLATRSSICHPSGKSQRYATSQIPLDDPFTPVSYYGLAWQYSQRWSLRDIQPKALEALPQAGDRLEPHAVYWLSCVQSHSAISSTNEARRVPAKVEHTMTELQKWGRGWGRRWLKKRGRSLIRLMSLLRCLQNCHRSTQSYSSSLRSSLISRSSLKESIGGELMP